jgi:hypothetical protein
MQPHGEPGSLASPAIGSHEAEQPMTMVAPPELLTKGNNRATKDNDMTERLDEHNISVDTQLPPAGACAQIHLPTGGLCTLPHHHHGSCEFLSPSAIAYTEKLPRRRARP